jgi:hypothetical protein
MAGRPPKPVSVLKMEKKSHRTKAELEAREKAESQLLTGVTLKAWPEVKQNKIANKEFNRLKKLLKIINHNDALHEAVINRYCLLVAECKQVEETLDQLRGDINELARVYTEGEIEYLQYINERGKLQDRMLAWDKKLMDKRKMLLQIEKESVMTILGALRAIPKKPEEKKESPMAEYLRRKRGS